MNPETNALLRQLIEGAGPANPFRRGTTPSRPEEGVLDVNTAFHGLENPAGGLPGPQMDGPPYTVKDGGLRLFHVVKTAWHAHNRMEERTPFHKSYADHVQRAVDTLALKGDVYHLPLRAKDGSVAGYAQFKRVHNRPTPVLATILGAKMTPSGQNIEPMLKQSMSPEVNGLAIASGKFDTDHIDPRPPESSAWNGNHQNLAAKEQGQYVFRRAFDGVTTNPRHEVIEDGIAPSEIPDLT